MITNWQGFRLLAWLAALLLVAAAVMAAFRGTWQDALVPLGFFLLLVIYLSAQRWLPSLFDFLFAVGLVLDAAGWTMNLFTTIAWYDEFTHAFMHMALAPILTFLVYQAVLDSFRIRFFALAVAVLTMGVTAGAAWEMLEWAGYRLFGSPSAQVLEDEISDLLMDTIGALAAVPLAYWALCERADSSPRSAGI